MYEVAALRDTRSHKAIRAFVAALALAVREARRDPAPVNASCKKLRISGRRLEVRVTRLVVGKRNPKRQDQVARWASAAAYVAHPLCGDAPCCAAIRMRRQRQSG